MLGIRQSSETISAETAALIPALRVDTTEKRRSGRVSHWCICYVHATFHGQKVVRKALLHDLSDCGAGLRCRSLAALPDSIRLEVPRLGLDAQARVVWQDSTATGISFELQLK